MTDQRPTRVAARAAKRRGASPTLDDATWARLEPLIPDPPRTARGSGRIGRPCVGNRAVINSLLHLATVGGALSDLTAEPGRLASGITCWRRVTYWRRRGAWPAIIAVLATLRGVDVARLERLCAAAPRPDREGGAR